MKAYSSIQSVWMQFLMLLFVLLNIKRAAYEIFL